MLSFVGESHFDVDAHTRLRTLLNRLKPDIISVEDVETRYEYDRPIHGALVTLVREEWDCIAQHNPSLNHDTFMRWFENLHAVPEAIEAYRNTWEVPIIFADDEDSTDRWITQGTPNPYLLNPELEQFLSLPLEKARAQIAQEYAQESYPVADSPELVTFYRERDEHAERILRAVIHENPGVHVVHVAGLDRVYGDHHNLYDRLSDLAPKRCKLSDADIGCGPGH
ncbi:MAG: hypothetical protein ACMXYM_00900 [Candidatus Woesearchaeota archaeon]